MSEPISNEAVDAEWTPRKVWELLGADYQPPLEAIRKVAQAHNAAITKACAERDGTLSRMQRDLDEIWSGGRAIDKVFGSRTHESKADHLRRAAEHISSLSSQLAVMKAALEKIAKARPCQVSQTDSTMRVDHFDAYLANDTVFVAKAALSTLPAAAKTETEADSGIEEADVSAWNPSKQNALALHSALAAEGVFKGFHGLEGLAKCQAFWDRQMYGTRLYYGDGIADYLHRSVLEAAISALKRVRMPSDPSGLKSANASSSPKPDTVEPSKAGNVETQNARLSQWRAEGWLVAAHNDYRLHGELFTFWLLTNEVRNQYVIGEGAIIPGDPDTAAFDMIEDRMKRLLSQHATKSGSASFSSKSGASGSAEGERE